MYTDVRRQFAVWYEPVHDDSIDVDMNGYKLHMGANSYFATAPRIKDWQEFKDTIIKFENGVLKGNTPTPSKESLDVFANFLENLSAKKDQYKKTKLYLTCFSIYEIIMLLILSDRNVCRNFFSRSFCWEDGLQYFIMCFVAPFSVFLLFIWRNEIKTFFKKITDSFENYQPPNDTANFVDSLADSLNLEDKSIQFEYRKNGDTVELWEKDVDDDDFIYTGSFILRADDFGKKKVTISPIKENAKKTTLLRLTKLYFQALDEELKKNGKNNFRLH
jgi:hypothetical protein